MAFYTFMILTIIWFSFMTFLSHQKGEETKRTSQELMWYLKFVKLDTEVLNLLLRRFAHIVVFAVLTFLLNMTLWTGGLPQWILGLAVIWSWGDERTKLHIDGRHFSWFDVALNLSGVGVGDVLYIFYRYKTML